MAYLLGLLTTLVEMIADFLGLSYAVTAAGMAAILALLAYFAIYTPKGRGLLKWLFINTVTDTLEASAYTIGNLTGAANGVVRTLIDAFNGPGKGIVAELTGPMAMAAEAAVKAVSSHLTAAHNVKPADWQKNANDAMRDAFSFGLASYGASAAFEALFPEKLNALNGIGPMLATMAGFEEVTTAWLRPHLDAAIARPARYEANARTRSAQLVEMAALNLYARGIITEADARQYLAYAGYPREQIDAQLAGAFRPMSPFVLAASLSDGSVDDATIRRTLTYSGFRREDQDLVIQAFHERLQQPYRQAALGALKTARERGVITDAEFQDGLNSLHVPDEVKGFINVEVGYRQLVQLTDLYRKGLDSAAEYKLIPISEYEPQLEAIGIDKADADAHTAIITNKVMGKDALAEERLLDAAARQARAIKTRAAEAHYIAGQMDDAAFLATLVASGWPGPTAAVILSAVKARKQGQLEYVHGVWLTRQKAPDLKDRIAVIEGNRKKNALSDAAAIAALRALNIPLPNATALVNAWAAAAEKKQAAPPA